MGRPSACGFEWRSQMEYKDYYQIMGVEEKASPEEIKKAYRKLARRYHPDVSKEPDAEQKFKDLGEAYEVLRDQQKRAEYDQLRQLGAMGGDGQFRPPPGWESATHFSSGDYSHGGDFSDFFEAIFGRTGGFHRGAGTAGTGGFSMRGEDVHVRLPLLLEEAFAGGEKLIEYQVPQVDEYGLISHLPKKIKLKIPAGISEGKQLRLKGQGAPGLGGESAGDLLIDVKLAPHPLYTVQGKNVSMPLPLSPWEAALGTKVVVPAPGGKLSVTVPRNAQAGKKLRIPAKGFPGSPPGDFFVVLKIVMPEKLHAKSTALFEEIAGLEDFNPRAAWEK